MGDSILGTGLSHHYSLLVSYFVALLAWDRVAHRLNDLWPRREAPTFARPWIEIAWFGLALVAVLAIGQLYLRHWLLPQVGPGAVVVEAINQILIFSPVLALPLIRRQGWDTAWLPMNRVWVRMLVGIVLSLIATLAFANVRTGADPWIDIVRDVYHPKNLGSLVQVFCEDVAIAILFVRVRAAVGVLWALIAVAVLFAAAHIPAMLAAPLGMTEIAGLVADAGLAIVVLYFLQRGGDVWWFFWVHFAMDMMQFYAVPGPVAPV
jgi:hypothetical protein